VWLGLTGCTPISNATPAADAGDGAGRSGNPAGCKEDQDCLVRSPCLAVHCERESCVDTPEADGIALADDQQVDGDCKKLSCDGRGQARNRPDDTDVPSGDGNACHKVACDQGEPKIESAPDSTPCNTTGT
jgi:hypothetical protein